MGENNFQRGATQSILLAICTTLARNRTTMLIIRNQMITFYQNIVPMIVPEIHTKVLKHCLPQFTSLCIMNKSCWRSILMKIYPKIHSTWIEQGCSEKLILVTINIFISWSTQTNQDLYQNWFMKNLKEGGKLKLHSEESMVFFNNTMSCLLDHQCIRHLSTFNEWCFPWVLG